jgi:hypothetical protein
VKRILTDHLNPYSLPEFFNNLVGARVLIADYPSIRKDFEFPDSVTDTQIDEWLLKFGAKISRTQIKSSLTPNISSDNVRSLGFRPPLYTRSAIFPISESPYDIFSLMTENLKRMNIKGSEKYQLKELFIHKYCHDNFSEKPTYTSKSLISGFDIKGIGHRSIPSHNSHSSGIIHLADCLREFVMEKLVRKALTHDMFDGKFQTIKAYAVLDANFEHIDREGHSHSCGLLLREIHDRPLMKEGAHVLTDSEALKLELSLRKLGFSSSGGKRHSMSWDPLNLQTSLDNHLVDFGSYVFLKKPDRPLRLPSLKLPETYQDISVEETQSFIPSEELIKKNPIHFSQDTSVNDSFSDNLFHVCAELASIKDRSAILKALTPYMEFIF